MGVLHVNPEVLEKVERHIVSILQEIHASSVLLIDRSGLVLAWAGNPPLHPNEMGAVAAGVFAAMRTLLKSSRTEDFNISVAQSGSNLQFQHVENGMFLCAVYADRVDEALVRNGLLTLAQEAVKSLTPNRDNAVQVETTNFIEEKLNELFRN